MNSKLATASEMLEDLKKNPELRKNLSKRAIWGLIELAEQEKTACSQQTA
ncbi:hypothetical protein [Brevibacillus borstelensis]|nr:hypothetical protein [Brevibacillus borstelensis]